MVEPAVPEPESVLPEIDALPGRLESESDGSTDAAKAEDAPMPPDAAAQQDDLEIAKYIEGVSRFIGNCTTPMTIAFQGKRGTGNVHHG